MTKPLAVLVLTVLLAGLTFAVPIVYGAATDKPAQFKLYKNNDYGFSIEYPDGWNVQELIFEKDGWTNVATFTEPKSSTTSFEIFLVKNAIKSDKTQGQEYLNAMITEYKNQCVNAVADKDLYTCSKFNLISSASGNFQGGNLYSTMFSQDVTISSISLTQIVGVHEIPDGADKWVLIITTNKADVQKLADAISHMEQSLKISDFTPQTSQTPSKTPSATSPQTTPQATKYLSYQNKQYGFSVKYPSDWKKTELLKIDNTFPALLNILSLSSPSGEATANVGFIQDDANKGVSQKILDTMKNEVKNQFESGFCSAASAGVTCSVDVYENSTTSKKNYAVHVVALLATMSSAQGSFTLPAVLVGAIPNGNDAWIVMLGNLSVNNTEQTSKVLGEIVDSFTISNYKGQKISKQSLAIAESSAGTLSLSSDEFTVSKYSPAEAIISGHVNSYQRGVPLTLKIVTPDNNSVEQGITVTKDGNFKVPLRIDSNWPAGNYQIFANYGSEDLGSISFLIKKS